MITLTISAEGGNIPAVTSHGFLISRAAHVVTSVLVFGVIGGANGAGGDFLFAHDSGVSELVALAALGGRCFGNQFFTLSAVGEQTKRAAEFGCFFRYHGNDSCCGCLSVVIVGDEESG